MWVWDVESDVIYSEGKDLDEKASTNRAILKTIASQYDLYNINSPLMNRCRLFLHELQCCGETGWDDKLANEKLKEWKNITRQVNNSTPIEINRFLGKRTDNFELIACTDASQKIFGTVIYILNLNSSMLSFVLSKNRIVNKTMKNKTIPALELQAVLLGVQTLHEIYDDMCKSSIIPIKIKRMRVLCDSNVSLSWLREHSSSFGKLQRRTVFVRNRLDEIANLCTEFPVTFQFISGISNPADCVTRCMSYKTLLKSNFISGPSIDELNSNLSDSVIVTIPNPKLNMSVDSCHALSSITSLGDKEGKFSDVLDVCKFSNLRRLIGVYGKVLTFIHRLKTKVKMNSRVSNIPTFDSEEVDTISFQGLLRFQQKENFPEIFEYFQEPNKKFLI